MLPSTCVRAVFSEKAETNKTGCVDLSLLSMSFSWLMRADGERKEALRSPTTKETRLGGLNFIICSIITFKTLNTEQRIHFRLHAVKKQTLSSSKLRTSTENMGGKNFKLGHGFTEKSK